MATKFYNVDKAAEVLGVTPAEVNAMRERQELHGYRDGADWKFKADEVDELAKQSPDSASESDVLLSEVEFGESDPGASGTVIGPPPSRKDAVDSAVSEFEDLDLTLTESSLGTAADDASQSGSSIDLGGEGLDDDDLVLGGSGSGSDITLGGDSGISLVDPTDSGLSLEEPLDLTGGSKQSLDLGGGEGEDEDDLLSLAEASTLGLAAVTDTDDDNEDFLLTPMDDGSSAIDAGGWEIMALEPDDSVVDEPEMAPLLDDSSDSIGPAPLETLGPATAPMETSPLEVATDYGAAQHAPGPAAAAVAPENAYSTWNIVSLAIATVLLAVVGMFMYDLMRNMWSWNGATPVTSSLMDLILGR